MGSSPFFISQVVFGQDGYAVVTNGSSAAADPAGLLLCQFPAYPEVPAGLVPAGESVRVPGSDLGGLEKDSGELGLYLRPDYADPDAITGYVQWGSTGHKREDPAVEAGVWDDGSFVDTGSGSQMETSNQGASSVGGWTVS